MSEVVVNPFDADRHDMEVIAALHFAVRLKQREDGENWLHPKLDIANSQADLTSINEYYVEPGGCFYVASDVDEDRVVGFAGLKRQNAVVCELKRLAVIPEYRGRQIGLCLVAACIEWARESGIRTIHLVTDMGEKASDLVYGPLGFSVTGTNQELSDKYMELDIA